jgi:ParB family chromosome partitioning protein
MGRDRTPEGAFAYGQLEIPFKPTADEKKKLKALEKKADEGDDDAYDQHETLTDAITQRGITPQMKAKAGVRITFQHNGFNIQAGLIRPAEKKSDAKSTAKGQIKDAPKKGPATLTKALNERLKEQRETAIKAALVTDKHGSALDTLCAGIVAAQIQPGRWGQPDVIAKALDKIAEAITPKVMNAALRKAFDPKGYFEGCGKAFCLAAITEAVNADEARKISKGKRGEIAKFALANVGKTPWLPKELRTSHYDGPAKKKAK